MGLMDSLGIGGTFGSMMTGLSNVLPGVSQYHSAEEAARAQRETNAASTANADKQMAFQERMSSTAVQRMKADMEQAGINPILAAGSGESTPPGASPNLNPAAMNYSGLSAGAMDVVRLLQDVKESDSRIGLNTASGKKVLADAGLAQSSTEKMSADVYLSKIKRQIFETMSNTATQMWRNDPKDKVYNEPGLGERMLDYFDK